MQTVLTEQELLMTHRFHRIEEKLGFIVEGLQVMTKVILNIDEALDILMEEKKDDA